MPYSLFTTRASKPSKRLQLLARAFQLFGAGATALATGIAVYDQFFLDHGHTPRWAFTPIYTYVLINAVSSWLIGRALMRRQRWGAYLAAITVGTPIGQQLLKLDDNILSVPQLAIGTLALCAIVTVWDELGTERDADFEHDDAKDQDPIRLLAEPIPTITTPPPSLRRRPIGPPSRDKLSNDRGIAPIPSG